MVLVSLSYMEFYIKHIMYQFLHFKGLQRMCSYYEPVNLPEYLRETGGDEDPFDSDDGYDYQEPIPLLASSSFNEVNIK